MNGTPSFANLIEKIENERHNLVDYSDRDFGGHRAKAVEHLDQALKELHMALEFDRR